MAIQHRTLSLNNRPFNVILVAVLELPELLVPPQQFVLQGFDFYLEPKAQDLLLIRTFTALHSADKF